MKLTDLDPALIERLTRVSWTQPYLLPAIWKEQAMLMKPEWVPRPEPRKAGAWERYYELFTDRGFRTREAALAHAQLYPGWTSGCCEECRAMLALLAEEEDDKDLQSPTNRIVWRLGSGQASEFAATGKTPIVLWVILETVAEIAAAGELPRRIHMDEGVWSDTLYTLKDLRGKPYAPIVGSNEDGALGVRRIFGLPVNTDNSGGRLTVEDTRGNHW